MTGDDNQNPWAVCAQHTDLAEHGQITTLCQVPCLGSVECLTANWSVLSKMKRTSGNAAEVEL